MNVLLLPQELQNLISEFNVEHRPKMNLVFNWDMLKIIFI